MFNGRHMWCLLYSGYIYPEISAKGLVVQDGKLYDPFDACYDKGSTVRLKSFCE